MSLTPLEITAITNFLLAAETYFLAGRLFAAGSRRFTAAGYWQWVLALIATSALLGGIDHGFFQTKTPDDAHRLVGQLNGWLIGGITLMVFLTTIDEFVRTAKRRRLLQAVAAIQFGCFLVLSLRSHSFLVVILNYVPVILWLLGACLSAAGRRPKLLVLAIGIVLSLIASALQASNTKLLLPLDHNGLYHLGMMVVVYFFYLGGRHLHGSPDSAEAT